jgi:hypothetical protein
MQSLIGFVELGAIVLAWLIVWNFVTRGVVGLHANNPAAQGFAAIFN